MPDSSSRDLLFDDVEALEAASPPAAGAPVRGTEQTPGPTLLQLPGMLPEPEPEPKAALPEPAAEAAAAAARRSVVPATQTGSESAALVDRASLPEMRKVSFDNGTKNDAKASTTAQASQPEPEHATAPGLDVHLAGIAVIAARPPHASGGNSDHDDWYGSEISGMESAISVNDENELAEIRVRTMFNLVEDVHTSADSSRLLYLTNMQAQMFSTETVPKMLQAFDVHNPSLVIQLMGSAGPEKLDTLPPEMTQAERANYHDFETHSVTGSSHSYLTEEERTGASRRLTTFFKEVLLPLAAETNAIIICNGYSSDMLTKTLAEVCPLFTARHGGKPPFTIFAMGAASSFERCSLHEPRSEYFVSEMANKSRNWRKGLVKIRDMRQHMESRGKKPRQASRQVLELQEGMGNYMIVEGLSGRNGHWKVDAKPLMMLQNMLLQGLGSFLPTLAVRTGHTNTTQPLTANMEFACRKIPVMMLDPQVRKWPRDELASENPSEIPSRDELIDKAIELNTQRHQSLWDKGKVAAYDQHDIAYFFNVLHETGSADHVVLVDERTNKSDVSLYESIQSIESAVRSAGQTFSHKQLDRVLDHMVSMMAETCFRILPAETQENMQKDPLFTPSSHYQERLTSIWSAYQDILQCPHIYGVNLEHLDAVNSLLNQIVKRDRLPSANSLQAQHLLRSAWNMVDTCVYNAAKYKVQAKVGQLTTLLLSTLVIALASFQGALAKFSPQISQDGIFYIATIIFLVTGMHTYLCPDDRWRELRATAEHIESEVFRFRTRTGAYSVSVSDPHATELTFRKKIEDLTTRAAQGAALGSSSFFRRYRGSVYMHGQNADTKMLRFDYSSVDKEAPVHIERCINENPDNHHSPMKPAQYITARLIPMFHFYQGRVPKKSMERNVTNFLLLTATGSTAVFSYMNPAIGQETVCANLQVFTACAAIVAGVASAISAWNAQQSPDRKLNRYTTAIMAIKDVIRWWESLTDVQQASLFNVNKLVEKGESIKMTEVDAWADTKSSDMTDMTAAPAPVEHGPGHEQEAGKQPGPGNAIAGP